MVKIQCNTINRFGENGAIVQHYESGALGSFESLDFQNSSMIGHLENPLVIDIPNWNRVHYIRKVKFGKLSNALGVNVLEYKSKHIYITKTI